MPDQEADAQRARHLLAQAFQEAEIEEPNATNQFAFSFGPTVAYWRNVSNGEVEVVISSAHWGSGRLSCAISLVDIAKRAAELFRDDTQAVSALVDTLKYFKIVMSLLLPITNQDILVRAFNLDKPLIAKDREIVTAARTKILDVMTSAFKSKIEETEKQLRAETNRRGGSKPKLPDDERSALHSLYSGLHKIAKAIKLDYNATLKRFAKSRGAKGYSHQEWRAHWERYSSDKYPDELKVFLPLFADEDNPSASEAAYMMLSKHTGHKRSYLPRLIRESRKAANTQQ